jgi:hypothetical protein
VTISNAILPNVSSRVGQAVLGFMSPEWPIRTMDFIDYIRIGEADNG